MQPIKADLPYPSTDCLTYDPHSGKIIAFAYASLHSELTAILQYTYHALQFKQYGKEFADTMEEIALTEMQHLFLLGETMLKTGVDPRFVQYASCNAPFFNSSTVAQSTSPQKMLMDNIEGELNAISDYKKMLMLLKNQQVSAIVQRIILDEQLHVETLKKLLEKTNALGLCGTNTDCCGETYCD